MSRFSVGLAEEYSEDSGEMMALYNFLKPTWTCRKRKQPSGVHSGVATLVASVASLPRCDCVVAVLTFNDASATDGQSEQQQQRFASYAARLEELSRSCLAKAKWPVWVFDAPDPVSGRVYASDLLMYQDLTRNIAWRSSIEVSTIPLVDYKANIVIWPVQVVNVPKVDQSPISTASIKYVKAAFVAGWLNHLQTNGVSPGAQSPQLLLDDDSTSAPTRRLNVWLFATCAFAAGVAVALLVTSSSIPGFIRSTLADAPTQPRVGTAPRF
jgi:hypothetical protein